MTTDTVALMAGSSPVAGGYPANDLPTCSRKIPIQRSRILASVPLPSRRNALRY
jgi:hypothetical protein